MLLRYQNLRLKKLQVKLVNISSNDIVDGNPKLTLGLVWSVILHWQVHYHLKDLMSELQQTNLEKTLLAWCRQTVQVNIPFNHNFSSKHIVNTILFNCQGPSNLIKRIVYHPISELRGRGHQELHDLVVGRPGVQRAAAQVAAPAVRFQRHRPEAPERPARSRLSSRAGTARH